MDSVQVMPNDISDDVFRRTSGAYHLEGSTCSAYVKLLPQSMIAKEAQVSHIGYVCIACMVIQNVWPCLCHWLGMRQMSVESAFHICSMRA